MHMQQTGLCVPVHAMRPDGARWLKSRPFFQGGPGMQRSSGSPESSGFVAIDFGTSNSAVALPQGATGVRLVALEPGQPTMPTAVFYRADTPPQQLEAERLYGRAAVRQPWAPSTL